MLLQCFKILKTWKITILESFSPNANYNLFKKDFTSIIETLNNKTRAIDDEWDEIHIYDEIQLLLCHNNHKLSFY